MLTRLILHNTFLLLFTVLTPFWSNEWQHIRWVCLQTSPLLETFDLYKVQWSYLVCIFLGSSTWDDVSVGLEPITLLRIFHHLICFCSKIQIHLGFCNCCYFQPLPRWYPRTQSFNRCHHFLARADSGKLALHLSLIWAGIEVSSPESLQCKWLLWKNMKSDLIFKLQILPHTKEQPFTVPEKYEDVFSDTSIHSFPMQHLQEVNREFWENCSEPVYDQEDVEIILSNNSKVTTWQVC